MPRPILIVDDHAGMRAVIRAVIAPLARPVIECADGAAAVTAFQHCLPDWTVMDIDMPILDGIEATRRIRALDSAARIVVVTDHGGEKFRAAALAAGAIAFVLKENMLELLALLSDPSANGVLNSYSSEPS